MKNTFIEKKIEKITYILEMIVAVLLAIGVIIGLIDLVRFFPEIFTASPAESYDLFEGFLGYGLILIVGIELILMILYHSTKAILELVLFVIARKMLIYSHTMVDLVFGTIAIALVFVILKFLLQKDEEDIVRRGNAIYAATANVKDILQKTGIDIPTDKGNTVGGLVWNLADEAAVSIEEGLELDSGKIRIKVTKATDDGVIEEVMITNKDEKKRFGSKEHI